MRHKGCSKLTKISDQIVEKLVNLKRCNNYKAQWPTKMLEIGGGSHSWPNLNTTIWRAK